MNEIGQMPNLIGAGVEQYMTMATNKSDSHAETLEKIESVGKEFEGVFLSLMLKEMRNTLQDGGFFGEDTSDTYGGMFDMFIGQDLATSSPLGIAKLMAESYERNQPTATEFANQVEAPESNTPQNTNSAIVPSAGINITR